MCGRYSFTSVPNLVARFKAKLPAEGLPPRFNAAPGQRLPVITADKQDEIQLFLWGLIPYWAKDPSSGFINARCETLFEKLSFRAAAERRRCLVPADSFYEWKKTKEGKFPYRIMLKDEGPFALAGIWDIWQDNGGRKIETFGIVTTKANTLVSKIHHRMPVLLQREDEEVWLNPTSNLSDIKKTLKPYPSGEIKSYPISRLINSPQRDSPGVIEPLRQQKLI